MEKRIAVQLEFLDVAQELACLGTCKKLSFGRDAFYRCSRCRP